jgi:hypothetical protein
MTEKSERSVYESWKRYHFANPNFYEQFHKFAYEAIRTRHKVGARLIIELIRWFEWIEKGSNLYRVCNNFAPYYARLLMLDKPEFKALFNTKSLKSGVTDADIIRDVIEPSRVAASGNPDHATGASGPKAT